jgi:Terminase large subunit, T4likevirus-type, N-terminal
VSVDVYTQKRRAIAALWHQGLITWKLTDVQKELYNIHKTNTHKTSVWVCSRRLGKSYALCVIAAETCLQKANAVVKFIAPTRQHVSKIIKPLLKEVFKDCPKDLRPEFKTAENIYKFKNGSEIQLAGTDNGHAESLRGGSSDLCIIDEAAFCDDLKYIVQSILIPTTTTTRGKIIMSSTPPKSSDHQFVHYMEQAEARGSYVKKTIYDGIGSRITQEIIDEIIEELGGVDSIDFRREYLCELVSNDEEAVCPAFTDSLQTKIVREWVRPTFYDGYVAGDIGAEDYTIFLFAYYDFKSAKIIVDNEVVMRGRSITTDEIAAEIRNKERETFLDSKSGLVKTPYLRICDNNLILISDLHHLHDLTFITPSKDNNQAAINNLNLWLKQEKIIIHPRCQTLIAHLKYAKWDKTGTKFKRSSDHGHYDAVDALKYLVRSIQESRNPYPSNYGRDSDLAWYGQRQNSAVPMNLRFFKTIFQPKK